MLAEFITVVFGILGLGSRQRGFFAWEGGKWGRGAAAERGSGGFLDTARVGGCEFKTHDLIG